MAEYRVTPAAERDLESIWTYTSSQWGAAQAERYVDMLTAAFTELAQSPRRAQNCDHIRANYRCSGIGRHVIYFRITSYGIAVVRALRERMDAPKRL